MDKPKIELWKTEGRFHCYKLIREVPSQVGRRFTTDIFRVPVDDGLATWALRLNNGMVMEGLPDNMTTEERIDILQAAAKLDQSIPQQAPAISPVPEFRLSILIEKYAAERLLGTLWSEKTRQENVSRLTIVCCYLNDPDLKQIRPLDITKMKEDFRFLQTHIKAEGLTHHQILADIQLQTKAIKGTKNTGNSIRCISVTTLNKFLNRFATFFDWCVDNGYADSNPAANKTIKLSEDEDDKDAARTRFSHENLKTIFESSFYAQHMYEYSYQYWVPHLALFTGARINELAQLAVSDIYEHSDGVWVIEIKGARSRSINKGDTKQRSRQTVKTSSSRRIIPVHPALIELGLLGFLQQRKKDNHSRLFPEITPGRDGYGQRVSRWFNETHMPKNLGFSKDEGLVFHSFRHTFSNDLKQKLMSNERYSHIYNKDLLVKAILGHKIDDITFETYSGPFRPQVTKIVIDELDWHLRLAKYEPPIKTEARKKLKQMRQENTAMDHSQARPI